MHLKKIKRALTSQKQAERLLRGYGRSPRQFWWRLHKESSRCSVSGCRAGKMYTEHFADGSSLAVYYPDHGKWLDMGAVYGDRVTVRYRDGRIVTNF